MLARIARGQEPPRAGRGDGHGQRGGAGELQAPRRPPRRDAHGKGLPRRGGDRGEDLDRLRDVLERDLADGFEAGSDLATRLLDGAAGDVDRAALRHLLEANGDVDPLAIDIAVLDDDVAEIDADPEVEAASGRDVVCGVGKVALRLDGALDGVDDAVEGDQRSVAGGLDDAAAALRDQRLERLDQRHDAAMGARLVEIDEPAVPDDVGRDDGGQPALHPPLLGKAGPLSGKG